MRLGQKGNKGKDKRLDKQMYYVHKTVERWEEEGQE